MRQKESADNLLRAMKEAGYSLKPNFCTGFNVEKSVAHFCRRFLVFESLHETDRREMCFAAGTIVNC